MTRLNLFGNGALGGDGGVDTPRDASFLARETAEAIER